MSFIDPLTSRSHVNSCHVFGAYTPLDRRLDAMQQNPHAPAWAIRRIVRSETRKRLPLRYQLRTK